MCMCVYIYVCIHVCVVEARGGEVGKENDRQFSGLEKDSNYLCDPGSTEALEP